MKKNIKQSYYTLNTLSWSYRWLCILNLLIIFSLTSCISQESFNIKNIVKSDIDMVTDDSLQQITKMMKQLTIKLYKRNPNELKKKIQSINQNIEQSQGIDQNIKQSINERVNEIFICPLEKNIKQVNYKNGTDAMLLSFDEEYKGDRVFAVMYGLYGMILESYNNRCEVFIIDFLDQQKFYNSARNIEILAWRFKHRVKKNGDLFLLTNETEGPTVNLSFERLYGKMIAIQDMMAIIMADKTNRAINEVMYSVGSVFLPMNF